MIKIVDGVLIMKLEKGELSRGDLLNTMMDRFEQMVGENRQLKLKIEQLTEQQRSFSLMFPN